MPAAVKETKVDCSLVTVKRSTVCAGDGVFALVDRKAGDIVEYGIVRRLPENTVDGDVCEHVQIWSTSEELEAGNGKEKTWAILSGFAMLINHGDAAGANVEMERDIENNSFVIRATKDIKAGTEVLHNYKMKDSRKCFADNFTKSLDGNANRDEQDAAKKKRNDEVDATEEASKQKHAEMVGMKSFAPVPKPSEMNGAVAHSSYVSVWDSTYGDGAFALKAFKKGDLIEYGEARRLTGLGAKGMDMDMIFTWSPDDLKVKDEWATATGAALFYNTSLEPNTEMFRYFGSDRYEIYAIKDIAPAEELTHTYRSLRWRKVFKENLPQTAAEEAQAQAAVTAGGA